jgi:hypothetical protein
MLSVVDPELDPVGSETLSGSGKNHPRSEQLRIRNEFLNKTTLGH